MVLATTQDSWSYTGNVDADSYSKVTVTVGENVTWNGAVDTDNNASSANVTVNSGAVWVLTGNSYVNKLVNNGTIITNGYTLSAKTTTGTGSQQVTGVDDVQADLLSTDKPATIYTLDGRKIGTTADGLPHGIYIVNGKQVML